MSYKALSYDISAQKGTDFIFYVKYLDVNNSEVDLVSSGYTASMQVREYPESSSKALDFSSTVFGSGGVTAGSVGGSGGILLNSSFTGDTGGTGTTGGIYVFADATTMGSVTAGRHFYELDLLKGRNVIRLVQGRIDIDEDLRR